MAIKVSFPENWGSGLAAKTLGYTTIQSGGTGDSNEDDEQQVRISETFGKGADEPARQSLAHLKAKR